MNNFQLIETITKFPSWAHYGLEYTSETDSDEDAQLISEFLEDYDGYSGLTFNEVEDSYSEFEYYPEFGPSCDCITLEVWGTRK